MRNVHLKPRPVILAATESSDQIGDALPLRDGGSNQRYRRMIRAEHGCDVILRNQTQRLLLADLWIALMIGLIKFDLCAAKIRQSGGGPQRQILQLGMRGVDDVGGHVDRVFRRLTRARGIAGKGIDDPNLDGIGRVRGNAGRGRKHHGNDAPCFSH